MLRLCNSLSPAPSLSLTVSASLSYPACLKTVERWTRNSFGEGGSDTASHSGGARTSACQTVCVDPVDSLHHQTVFLTVLDHT